jgi:hypothetical protein
VTKPTRLACSIGALLCLILAAPAAAAPKAVPPGHSGASQYTETLPTAGGEQPTGEVGAATPAGGGGKGNGPSSGGGSSGETPTAPAPTTAEALGARDAKRLEKLGPEGKAAAALAAAASPTAADPGGAGAAARHAAGGDGSSPVKQVVGQLTGTSGSGGMGLLLPLLIAMSVLVAVAFVLTRRRPTAGGE